MTLLEKVQNYSDKTYNFLFVFLAFALPFRNALSGIAIFALLLLWILDKRRAEHIKRIFSNKVVLLIFLVYVVHVVGLLYTSNFRFAISDLEIKLPLLILPLVIFSRAHVTTNLLRKIAIAFTLGCVIAASYCIGDSYLRYKETQDAGEFFYINFSVLMHTSYFSMYLNFGILMLIFLFLKNRYRGDNKITINLSVIFVSLFFLVCIVLLSSKAGIIITTISSVLMAFYLIKIRKEYLIAGILVSVITVFMYILPKYAPTASKRLKLASEQLIKQGKNGNEIKNAGSIYIDGISARILILKSALKITKENPLIGVGTGDIKDELIKEYEKVGFTLGIERKFNSHNQYIQFLAAFGIIGFVVFLLSLGIPLKSSWKEQNYLYLFFISVFALHLLFESALETKAGVEFFAFFNALLLSFKKENKLT